MTIDLQMIARAMADTERRASALVMMRAALVDDDTGNTPSRQRLLSGWLTASAVNGWDDAVRMILAARAAAAVDKDGALYWASARGHAVIVERLLAAGAARTGADGALSAAAAAGHAPVADRLLAAGVATREGLDRALCLAAGNGHLPIVESLLDAGAGVDAGVGTALLYAAGIGHLPIVERLLAADADVHTHVDASLRAALANGHTAVAESLLRAGADAWQAWNDRDRAFAPQIAAVLNMLAAAIPARQRAMLLRASPLSFPALRALCAVERRKARGRWRFG